MYQTQNVNSDEAEKLLAKGKKKKEFDRLLEKPDQTGRDLKA